MSDLSDIDTFAKAFREARRRGLKKFTWKKTQANPSGIFTTEIKKAIKTEPIDKQETSIKESRSKKEEKPRQKETIQQTQQSVKDTTQADFRHNRNLEHLVGFYENRFYIPSPIRRTPIVPPSRMPNRNFRFLRRQWSF